MKNYGACAGAQVDLSWCMTIQPQIIFGIRFTRNAPWAITHARSIRIKHVEFSKYTMTNKSIHLFVFRSTLGTVLNFIHYKVFFLKLCGNITPFINAFQPTKMDRSSKTFLFYNCIKVFTNCT